MYLIIIWAMFCIVPAAIASGKGRSGIGFFLLSFFLSPLVGLIAALIASPAQKPTTVIVQQSQAVLSQPISDHVVEDHVAVLERLAELKSKGVITEDEFLKEKAKLYNKNTESDMQDFNTKGWIPTT